MAYGVVPVSTNISSIPQYLRRFETGRTFAPDDLDGFTKAFRWYAANPDVWKQESLKGMQAAHEFTYDAYLNQLRTLMKVPLVDSRVSLKQDKTYTT
jgi:glycosyltransferase involved in cell wall biosynthesis